MKKIVKGNDFTLKIPVMKMVEGQPQAFPLPAFDYAYNTILTLGGEEQRGFIMSIGQELVHVANLETIKEILTELFDASTATAYETFVKKTLDGLQRRVVPRLLFTARIRLAPTESPSPTRFLPVYAC